MYYGTSEGSRKFILVTFPVLNYVNVLITHNIRLDLVQNSSFIKCICCMFYSNFLRELILLESRKFMK